MRNDFIEHSAKGTSWKAGVKYLKKVPLGNGRYYYIYTQAELNAWNKRHSQGSANNVLSNKEVEKRKQQAFSSPSPVDNLVKSGMKAAGNTKEEKEANLKKNIADGEKLIAKELNSSDSTKKSSKKGSGGSSKKSSGSKSKGGSGGSKSSSKKEKSGSSKEKTSKEKTAKENTSKTEKTNNTSKQKTNTKKKEKKLSTMESIMLDHSVTNLDADTFSGSSSDFKKKLLKKYKDGSSGYLSAGNNVYRFLVEDGDVILKDYVTNKEVSFDKYLKDARSFKEFAINKKKT